MKKLVDNVVPEKPLREAQLRALKLFSDTVGMTYGPLGGYTAYSKMSSDGKTMAVSNYSKDGFTIHKNIECDMPIESILKEEIRDICTQVLKVVGDGTSSAVMLSYIIFEGLVTLQKMGYKKRKIIKAFKNVVAEISEAVEKNGRKTTLDDIYDIALTSLDGNEEMAKVIYDIYKQYGMGVFIDVQGNSAKETVIKGFDGMIYDNGYLDPCFINRSDHTCTLEQPHIYVFDCPVDTPTMIDIFHLIIHTEIEEPNIKLQTAQRNGTLKDKIAKGEVTMPYPTIIFAPHFSRDANSYLDQIIASYNNVKPEQRYGLCIVQTGAADPNKLIDICKLSGGKFIKKYIDPEAFKKDQALGLAPNEMNIRTFAGSAEKIIVDKLQTKILNPSKMRDENYEYTEYFKNYVSNLEDQLEKLQETNQEVVEIGNLKRRIHIIKGNMVDLYVGGIGTSDKRSLTDAVEDAVLNCRSAAQDGVGYGASYEGLRASMDAFYNSCEKGRLIDEDAEYCKVLNLTYNLVATAYMTITKRLYEPYFEDEKLTKEAIHKMLKEDCGPLNIITEKYDGTVLTSIKSEPAILDSISRIITVLFNTNQFLLPTPQFNIYKDMEAKTVIRPDGTTEEVVDEEEEIPKLDLISIEEVRELWAE